MNDLVAYSRQCLDSCSTNDGKMLLTVACPAGMSRGQRRDYPILIVP